MNIGIFIMNLLEIRTKWIDTSGRYDLVEDVTDYVDNGANFSFRLDNDCWTLFSQTRSRRVVI